MPPEAVVRRFSVNKGVLKNFSYFTVKHLRQSLSFNKVAALKLWNKRFLWILWKFEVHLFLQKTSGGSFYFSSVLDTLETL